MEITHDVKGTRFVAKLDAGAAVLEYELVGNATMDIQSTFVPMAARGQGIAGELVDAAVRHARANGLKIIPSCSYVVEWLREHPEARDLV